MTKQNKEKIQTRREFFKRAAKGALPVLGILFLSNLPFPQIKASTTGCDYGCKWGCDSSCYGDCISQCSGCKGTCSGDCYHRCYMSCQGSCYETCKGLSYS